MTTPAGSWAVWVGRNCGVWLLKKADTPRKKELMGSVATAWAEGGCETVDSAGATAALFSRRARTGGIASTGGAVVVPISEPRAATGASSDREDRTGRDATRAVGAESGRTDAPRAPGSRLPRARPTFAGWVDRSDADEASRVTGSAAATPVPPAMTARPIPRVAARGPTRPTNDPAFIRFDPAFIESPRFADPRGNRCIDPPPQHHEWQPLTADKVTKVPKLGLQSHS